MFKMIDDKNACPLCNGRRISDIYPIDKGYAASMSNTKPSEINFSVVRCSTCQHQFISPMPSEGFLEAFYSSYMSSAKSGFYEQRYSQKIPDTFRSYYGRWLDQIILLSDGNVGHLLDIGSGLGMFLRLAKEKGFGVSGIEPNAEAVEYLAREFTINVSNTLIENYNSVQKFDVITMWDLLEHLAAPVEALKKVRGGLNPNGLLVLEIPVRDSLLHAVAKMAYKLTFGIVKRPLFLTYGVHHLQYFSEKSIVEFLSDNGFETLAVYRSETDAKSIKKNLPVGFTARIKLGGYNWALTTLLFAARLTRMQNKVVVFARLKHG